MKINSLLVKNRLFSGNKKNKENGGSSLSRDLNQKGYREKYLNTESRKKSLREKWQAKREGRKLLVREGIKGQKTEKKQSLFVQAALAGVVLISVYFATTGVLSGFLGDLLYFRIHEIEFSGCVVTNQKDLRKYANITYELNMLTLHPKAIEERLERHAWIKKATVRRIWPDGLVVSIKEFRPRALVAQGDDKSFQYLDRNGALFAAVEAGQDIDFPVITGLDVFKTEPEKKELIASANMFLRLAGENNPNLPAQNISEIHFTTEGELILYLVERPFPIYFGKGAIRRKFSQLHRVLKVLYKKKKGKAIIEEVAYIRMDYQDDKVLVARNHSG